MAGVPARRVDGWPPSRADYRPAPGSIPTRRASTGSATPSGRVIYVGKAKYLRAAAVVVLPGPRQPAPAHRHDGHHGGQRRVDRGQHRGRGAAAGVLLDQGVRPALQREVPRRQVLPVARGHRQRGVPAGDGRARRQEARASATSAPTATPGRSARPSTCCCGSSRCARASNGVFKRSAPDRPALPARLHRQVRGALRRPGHAPRSTARSSTTSATSWPASTTAFVKRLEQEMYAASDGARTTSGPPGSATTSARSSRRWRSSAVVLGDGTDADVIALAEDPLEVAVQIFYVRGGRIRGQRGWVADRVDDADTADLVERFLLQLYDGERGRRDPARGPGARAARTTPATLEELARATCGAAGWRSGCRSAATSSALQETVARNAAPGAGAAQDQAGQRPHHPQPGARGDPGGARPRRGAAADRVLRRLQPAGHRGGRLDGGLRGRPAAQERVPPVRDQGRRRPERRRRRCTR